MARRRTSASNAEHSGDSVGALRDGGADGDSDATVGPASIEARSHRAPRASPRWGAVAGAAVLIIVAVGWEFAARRGFVDPFFVSQPSAIVMQIVDWWHGATSNGPLAIHIGVTLKEAAVGLIVGSIAGACVGWMFQLGAFGKVTFRALRFAEGIFSLAASIAIGAALLLALGPGSASSKAALASWLVGGRAYADARAGLSTSVTLRERSRLALAGALIGECLGSHAGIGFLMMRAVRQFNASGIYAALVLLVLLTWGIDVLATALQTTWRHAAAKFSARR